MPPKRFAKNSLPRAAPPVIKNSASVKELAEPSAAELKFDREVLWCISQFENLLGSGKLQNEAKRQETMKAIKTLRNPNLPNIRKTQLMRLHFKDVKLRMNEELIQNSLIFQLDDNVKTDQGTFVKKKLEVKNATSSGVFLFNFKDPSIDELPSVEAKLNSLNLSK